MTNEKFGTLETQQCMLYCRCISEQWHCDYEYDCDNGEDEVSCGEYSWANSPSLDCSWFMVTVKL